MKEERKKGGGLGKGRCGKEGKWEKGGERKGQGRKGSTS